MVWKEEIPEYHIFTLGTYSVGAKRFSYRVWVAASNQIKPVIPRKFLVSDQDLEPKHKETAHIMHTNPYYVLPRVLFKFLREHNKKFKNPAAQLELVE